MGRGEKIGFFLFSRDLAGHALQQADWALALDRLYAHKQAQADNACIAQIK